MKKKVIYEILDKFLNTRIYRSISEEVGSQICDDTGRNGQYAVPECRGGEGRRDPVIRKRMNAVLTDIPCLESRKKDRRGDAT